MAKSVNPDQESLFTTVDADTFNKQIGKKHSRARSPKTEPRTLTTWYDLTHHTGFCTVPAHEEIQETLKPDQLEYRQRYPTRHLFTINDVHVCRDCFIHEGDKKGGKS